MHSQLIWLYQDGSANALRTFFGEECALVRVVRRLCQRLNLVIEAHVLNSEPCPLLGCGNSGVVYRAITPGQNAVALKVVLKPDYANNLVVQHELNRAALYVDLEFFCHAFRISRFHFSFLLLELYPMLIFVFACFIPFQRSFASIGQPNPR
jgi:hypothetical protein